MNIPRINPEEILFKQLSNIKHQMIMFHLGIEERRKNWYFEDKEDAQDEIETIREVSETVIKELNYLEKAIVALDDY